MDMEALHAVIHGITKSQTWLSDWTELNWDICKMEIQTAMEISIHMTDVWEWKAKWKNGDKTIYWQESKWPGLWFFQWSCMDVIVEP